MLTPEEQQQAFSGELGRLIREAREREQYSLEQVAQDTDCGLSKSSLSLIEQGAQQITARQLFKVSRTLKFSVDDFYERINKALLMAEHPELSQIL